jgi:hypothetical protein
MKMALENSALVGRKSGMKSLAGYPPGQGRHDHLAKDKFNTY